MKVMLDSKAYISKPKNNEIASLNERLIRKPQELSVSKLAQELINGKTFTPAFFEEKEGVIRRQREFWSSQQIVALDFDDGMTLEQAFEEFVDTAAFIYTTFSHTEQIHKFRVVFVLDKPTYSLNAIEELLRRLLVKYPADKKCSDCTRIFFGGKKVVELNYDNRIQITDFGDKVSCGIKESKLIYPVKNPEQQEVAIVPKTTSISRISNNKAKNIELIKQQDFSELHRRINPEPRVVHNNFEMMDYLKQQDLRLFLGIENSGSFIDIFHDENNPSAGIFASNKSNGHQLYKCHSNSNPFIGTIFHITQSLLKCTVFEARKFLMKLYQIELVENEIQKELRVEIDFYKEALQSEDLEELYPDFYKLFSRYDYLRDLYILLDLVKEHLPAGDDPRLLFHHSIETISKKFKRSTSATHTRLNLFSFFKLVTKLGSHEVPPKLLEIQQLRKKGKGHKYRNSTYELPLRNYDFFNELDAMSRLWMEKGCTTNSVNYEGILRNFGVEEADRVFPQDKGKIITSLGEDITRIIAVNTLELIEDYGYTTEQEVLSNVNLYFKGQQKFKKKQFKICIGELMDGYDLERIRLNKQLKAELNISGNGYGYIIRKKQYIGNIEETLISCKNSGILD